MTKKIYQKPTVDEIKFNHKAYLLTGSFLDPESPFESPIPDLPDFWG